MRSSGSTTRGRPRCGSRGSCSATRGSTSPSSGPGARSSPTATSSCLREADTSGWRAAPGAEEALERLEAAGHRLALLTGNPEPVARARLERLGLARHFPAGQGAFGCESESRGELIALARARAGDWPADRTVEVGDTAVDVSSAEEAGIRSLRVGPGTGLADALAQLG